MIDQLHKRLSQPLPGWKAQWELVPQGEARPHIPEHHRKGAVLAFFYPHEGEYYLSLMQRAFDGSIYAGQISFPGGGMEDDDPDLTYTALRESEEELGIPAKEVKLIGTLTDLYIPISNFLVIPIVGYTANRPCFRLCPREVHDVVEIPVSRLLHLVPQLVTVPSLKGNPIEVKAFVVNEHVIWGVTAMILSELITVLKTSV